MHRAMTRTMEWEIRTSSASDVWQTFGCLIILRQSKQASLSPPISPSFSLPGFPCLGHFQKTSSRRYARVILFRCPNHLNLREKRHGIKSYRLDLNLGHSSPATELKWYSVLGIFFIWFLNLKYVHEIICFSFHVVKCFHMVIGLCYSKVMDTKCNLNWLVYSPVKSNSGANGSRNVRSKAALINSH